MSDDGLLLAFRAGGERFAVPLERVREAARPRRIAPLPGAPPEWSGVALVRGEALGVIDVAAAMGLPRSPAKPAPLVVVLYGTDHALLVDSIDGVETCPADRVAPPPPGRGALRGIVAEESGFLSLLDVDRLAAKGEG
ncbi:MAG TPA: chemotaxis protein CheW [Thermoanaerobaculia bacterium]|nr:chemotaxis protein CheW [Thermoanaerobaculia bacterium]HQN07062.1 chemotaxis protein CheW [Thermoanaerobaculia bacterium]HQP85183.1 chemotaxis protein CheW [Thermoanaerobaculia bacterium]